VDRVPVFIRLIRRSLALLLVSTLAVTVSASRASATLTVICTGYTGCAHLSLSSSGYDDARGTMWWRMYAGHNCTNYVAYRMVRSGLPNTRPWSGNGNATNWGVALKDRTNHVPAVGAVAWWRANARPAGSVGHVAYVERVVSPDEIIVSQDSWGGDFSWARIRRVGGSWPSGFIHLNDARLLNKVSPTVTGVLRVGSRLTATGGTWRPSTVALGYQWQANGHDLPGATTSGLRLTPALLEKRISVRATASQLGYRRVGALSARTRPVAAGRFTATAPPAVRGAARVGETLSATAGAWVPAPTSLSYQWSAAGKPVKHGTGATLPVGPTLVGKALRVTVTAVRPGYRPLRTSSAKTPPVALGRITTTATPAVLGIPRPGALLRLRAGSVTPRDAGVSVTWWRSGVRIKDATRTSYRVTASDLGGRIAARATLTKAGYATRTLRTPYSARVRSVPRISLVVRGRHGRLRATASVSAVGVGRVPGRVRIGWRGHPLRQVVLHGGSGTGRLDQLPAGVRRLAVQYTGSRLVEARTVTRTVRVG
jgi:surface antigen